ncbi:MAG: 50S ribosomal protein L20 [Candidatus Saganbacteria bacterium]|nr:50S ribosomal protein L20 [Candidatus Saganbacteria bacterium]
MVRVKRGNVARKRRKKLLARAKGFRGSLRKIFRPAKQAVVKAMVHATRDRRDRKAMFRKLWTIRINAAARQLGMSYSRFIAALAKAKVAINRKQLADLAVNDNEAFAKIVALVKGK